VKDEKEHDGIINTPVKMPEQSEKNQIEPNLQVGKTGRGEKPSSFAEIHKGNHSHEPSEQKIAYQHGARNYPQSRSENIKIEIIFKYGRNQNYAEYGDPSQLYKPLQPDERFQFNGIHDVPIESELHPHRLLFDQRFRKIMPYFWKNASGCHLMLWECKGRAF
jgi:hypothetical protein